MSTRATYLLPATSYSNQLICFYIHHDGYLIGAARYFYNMQQCKNKRGWLAGRFFRANSNAEFTKDHEEHSDTDFRYAINHQDVLTAWQKDSLKNEWQVVYEGPWYQFVNTYFLEAPEHLHVFKLNTILQNETIMTIAEAQEWVQAFTSNTKKDSYVPEGVDAIQAQIDAILAQQKTGAN